MKVGEEKLWQNWGHYAKLCSRQKCTFVSLQIYHESLPLTMHSVLFAIILTHFKSNINIIWKFLIGCCLWSYFRCQTFLQIKLRGWLFWFWNEGGWEKMRQCGKWAEKSVRQATDSLCRVGRTFDFSCFFSFWEFPLVENSSWKKWFA